MVLQEDHNPAFFGKKAFLLHQAFIGGTSAEKYTNPKEKQALHEIFLINAAYSQKFGMYFKRLNHKDNIKATLLDLIQVFYQQQRSMQISDPPNLTNSSALIIWFDTTSIKQGERSSLLCKLLFLFFSSTHLRKKKSDLFPNSRHGIKKRYHANHYFILMLIFHHCLFFFSFLIKKNPPNSNR